MGKLEQCTSTDYDLKLTELSSGSGLKKLDPKETNL